MALRSHEGSFHIDRNVDFRNLYGMTCFFIKAPVSSSMKLHSVHHLRKLFHKTRANSRRLVAEREPNTSTIVPCFDKHVLDNDFFKIVLD